MKFIETIDKYLDEKVSCNSYDIYKGKIYVFYKYLVKEKGINDNSYSSYLCAMKIEEIQDSLNFYIEDNSINTESSAWHYISVIKVYFSFLYDLGIKNLDLMKSFGLPDTNKDSFQYKIGKQINEDKRLEKKGDKEEITFEEAKILISECEQQIKKIVDENDVLKYNKYPTKYNDLLYGLIIKLMLLSGVAYRKIRSIEVKDLNNIHNTICINNYTIHLPNSLSEQLSYYMEIRRNVLINNNIKCNNLFINADGSQLSIQTSLLNNKLKKIIGRGDVKGVIKFAIMEMIKKGINQNVIQSFTEVGSQIYDYCQNKVNEFKTLSASRYLDSKIRSLEIFDFM